MHFRQECTLNFKEKGKLSMLLNRFPANTINLVRYFNGFLFLLKINLIQLANTMIIKSSKPQGGKVLHGSPVVLNRAITVTSMEPITA